MDSGQNYPYQNKDMFLDYGGDKRFVVKGYVDASFDTNLDDSKVSVQIHIESGSNQLKQLYAEHCRHRNLQNTYGSEFGRPVD